MNNKDIWSIEKSCQWSYPSQEVIHREQKYFLNCPRRNKIDTEWQILHDSSHVSYKPKLVIITQVQITTVLVSGSGGRNEGLLLNRYKVSVV